MTLRLIAGAVAFLITMALAPGVAHAQLSGRWAFDVRDGRVLELSGLDRTLHLKGQWSRVTGRNDSSAVRFASTSVGKVADHRSLDPGRRSFSVSAVFKVPSGTDAFAGTDSPNLVQKGSYGSPGQWKIQLTRRDGGSVQCRMKGTRSAVLMTSPVTGVAKDRKWHTVSCVRRNQRVVLVVDGVRAVRHVAVGRIANGAPMTVANKASQSRSDQFRGVIDALAIAKGDAPLRRTLRATRQ